MKTWRVIQSATWSVEVDADTYAEAVDRAIEERPEDSGDFEAMVEEVSEVVA